MSRRAVARGAAIGAGVLAGLLVLVAVIVLVATNTDWGRERVRRQLVSLLDDAASGGNVRIGRLDGNLLRGVIATDVSITDDAGAPLFTADSVYADYDLFTLVDQRLWFDDVRLVNPLVVLDQRPGEPWNYEQIFPSDTTAPADTTAGFGDWVRLEDVTVVDGHVVVRTEWEPDEGLAGPARGDAIEAALDPESRVDVVRVAGGFQTVYDFREIDARFPLLRIEDPAETTRIIDVAALEMIASPFRPPPVEVRDLRGRFLVTGDSLWFDDAVARLPESQIAGAGTVTFGDEGTTTLRLRGTPVATGDLQWLYPSLPAGGTATLGFVMRLAGDTSLYLANDADVRLDGAVVRGDFGLQSVNDTLVFRDTDLRFSGVQTSLVERLVPDAELPRAGTLSGEAMLAGPLSDLRLTADVVFDDRAAGRNRVVASGELGLAGERLRFESLRVELQPLQVALLEAATDEALPIRGVITGEATLDGVLQEQLRARFDLTHRGAAGISRLTGSGVLRQQPSVFVDVDARLHPLSLATVGRFAPGVGLRSSVSGPVSVRGTLGNLVVDGRLVTPNGGVIAAEGALDLAGDVPAYDVRLGLRLFDANELLAEAPSSALTATALARGRGTDPATMNATIRADLETSRFDTLWVDSATVRVQLADGLADVDSLALFAPSSLVAAEGTFGLRPDRTGTLVYRVAIDSLSAFAQYLGVADTTVTPPRPALRARALARARADSARRDTATMVERMVTGGPPPQLEVEEVPAIARDSVAGELFAAGVVQGNLERVSVRGRAAVRELVVRGNAVESGRAEYAWIDGLTPQATIIAGAKLDSVRAAGFALDSVDARVAYQGERGTADVVIVQDTGTDYRARANFRLALDENELLFQQLAVRFDTTRWVAQQPGRILWGGRGVFVDSLELVAGPERRIFVNGLIPATGPADLTLAVSGFQLAHVAQLLQSDVEARGILSAEAQVSGTAEAPRIVGALAVNQALYDETALPDVRATFEYANERLAWDGTVTPRNGSVTLASIRGEIPVDLALQGAGERLPDAPISVAVDADSLPLGVLGELTDLVSNVAGSAAGAVRVRGTLRDPQVAGALAVRSARALIVPAGVTLQDISGILRLRGDSVFVDSLVGYNTGRIFVRGAIGIEQPTAPSFDLYLVANDATILDNDLGELRADAGLAMRGPFDDAYISGAATITQGVIRFEEPTDKDPVGADDPALFNVVDTAVASEVALLPEPSPLLQNLRMDVALGISRNTWVRSENANVEVHTPDDPGPLEISVDQSANRLVIRGQVTTERGEYRYLSKRFEVDRGAVVFIGSPDLNPLLQITGRYEVKLPAQKALTIRILIGGTLQSPQLALESDAQPPLPQSDLISYLAFGRTSSSLLQLDGSALAGGDGGVGVGAVGAAASQRLGAVALGVLVESAESELTRGLGADVLNITPADVSVEALNPFNNVDALLRGTEVTAGKYVNPRTFLSLTVRPSLFSQDKENRFIPGVRVQHSLRPGISLEATFEGRYLVQPPTLENETRLSSTGVFGLFLIREWGW